MTGFKVAQGESGSFNGVDVFLGQQWKLVACLPCHDGSGRCQRLLHNRRSGYCILLFAIRTGIRFQNQIFRGQEIS